MADKERPGEFGSWVRAGRYRDRAAEILQLADAAMTPEVRDRYFTVAQHYIALAELEEQVAKREGRLSDAEAGRKTRLDR
jgi:hypothetical protein